MDLSFSPEQKLIKDAAREFLEKECPADLVREMEEDELGYSPGLWRKMGELGWPGLIIPEKYGGSGGTFLDLVPLLEEMGRYLAPVPFFPTVILGALSLMEAGSEAQKQKILPEVATGRLILTMALIEPDPLYHVSGIHLQASPQGNGFLLYGTKIFVPYAHVADYLLCAARTENVDGKGDVITLFLIDRESPGIRCEPLKTVDWGRQCEVTFDGTKVPAGNIIGKAGEGWPVVQKVMEQAIVAQCALMIGGAEKVLEMTVAHAKRRVQFGRPIGSFQAVQHRCANMLVDLDGARFVVYEAAWRLSQALPCALEASTAKAWVNQAYQRICANGHQVHGGIGVIKDQEMYLYSRSAKAAETLWGDTAVHREMVARELGL
jgi:alkylation response protein AidB-like acyl-CoA dehydrogenase